MCLRINDWHVRALHYELWELLGVSCHCHHAAHIKQNSLKLFILGSNVHVMFAVLSVISVSLSFPTSQQASVQACMCMHAFTHTHTVSELNYDFISPC